MSDMIASCASINLLNSSSDRAETKLAVKSDIF
jgi:hypothetical protein